MGNCKHCGSGDLRKNGFNRGKQRYFCKSCKRSQVEGDNRGKYSLDIKRAAIMLYLEGCGFRSTARILRKIFSIKINFQHVIYWVKKMGKIVENRAEERHESKDIKILELDELYTFIKKKQTKSEYGLLLTETGLIFLRLKSEMVVPIPSKNSGKN
jgi:transposase-like protein